MKKIIENLIKNELSIFYIHIDDLTKNHEHHKGYDGGGHYRATIVSDDFKNLNLLKRHQKIYKILNGMMKKEIHALSMQTLTTEEYETKKAR